MIYAGRKTIKKSGHRWESRFITILCKKKFKPYTVAIRKKNKYEREGGRERERNGIKCGNSSLAPAYFHPGSPSLAPRRPLFERKKNFFLYFLPPRVLIRYLRNFSSLQRVKKCTHRRSIAHNHTPFCAGGKIPRKTLPGPLSS